MLRKKRGFYSIQVAIDIYKKEKQKV